MKITKFKTRKDQSQTADVLEDKPAQSATVEMQVSKKRDTKHELDRRKFMQTSLLALASTPAMVMAD